MPELTAFQRQVLEASYEGSPDTMFVMRLGRELAILAETPAVDLPQKLWCHA